MPQRAPYGTWPSPITLETVVSSSIVFDDVLVDPITSVVYHIEERPDEGGRSVIVNTAKDRDVIPSDFNARDAVNEYGGAPAVVYGGTVYFSNITDGRVYSVEDKLGSQPSPVSPEDPKKQYRYANFAVHPVETNLIASILEYHPDENPQNVVTTLCVIDTATTTRTGLVEGADFYASPVFNPSGTKIAWQEWYQPDMPFEGALIYIADVCIINGAIVLSNRTYVAGKKLEISATYPTWISNTTLLYTSDESNGFQNPFIYSTTTGSARPALANPIDQDFAEPAWFFGLYPYALLGDGSYGAFTAFQDGRNILYVVDLTKPSDPVLIPDFPFVVAQHLKQSGPKATTFVFTASLNDQPGGVLLCTLGAAPSFAPTYEYLKRSAAQPVSNEYISPPQPFTLCKDGDPNGPLYATLYLPKNPDFQGLDGEKPPCITHVHGGPTSMTTQALSLQKMFFTSRGFAWLDVNYRGSSGYGRAYIERLAGNWGILDNQDCEDAVTILGDERDLVDSKRAAVRGGSAGGYTTLCSVTTAKNNKYYKAATSAYGGISDLELLAQATEKFELQYMYKLLGGSPKEIPEVYKARSPYYNVVDSSGVPQITIPLLMLQGKNDPVVPEDQATRFLDEIKKKAPNEKLSYHFYDNEGHGWKQASTIKDALKREHEWYLENLL
ncbi:Alpha/Beta hydrolase protein [Pisolithus microcarpus]|nr:Alpha/Beta hydrolase protein [Pisolithus microcarpus]